MGQPLVPQFSEFMDIWTGKTDGSGPLAIRKQQQACQIFSAFGAGARVTPLGGLFQFFYTHVILFPPETDVRDDWPGDASQVPPPVTDWLAFPAGQAVVLRVIFAERRGVGTLNEYLRVYCQRLAVLGEAPPL